MPEILRESDKCIVNKHSIFSVLEPEEINILKSHHTCRLYKKGEIIFNEGEKPIGLTVLSEGQVKVFKEGVGGREQITRLAKPVGFIGYRALFAEESHIASAVAIEDSYICIISKDGIYKLIRSNNKLAILIIKTLATELGLSNNRTITLTQKHIRGRLAESLLFLIDTYGLEQDNKTINIYLSREDIANLSSMTTSNAIRTLSAFAHEGAISLNGRRIKVEHIELLRKISRLG